MLKAVNLIGMYVTDTATSVSFYKSLGFAVLSDDGIVGEVTLADFKLDLIAKDSASEQDESFQKEAFGEPEGTGLYKY